ncbi:MAG: PleD family two-component system response regulator [Candidatus Competibacterales bacterium]
MSINKILVVDDSAAELNFLKTIVSEAGFAVVAAQSGQEALDIARQEHPDLIFLDIIMPDMDGFATCRELHNDPTTKDIPVVFVTSKNQKADRLWAQMTGAKAFITKPYTADVIIDQIKALQ